MAALSPATGGHVEGLGRDRADRWMVAPSRRHGRRLPDLQATDVLTRESGANPYRLHEKLCETMAKGVGVVWVKDELEQNTFVLASLEMHPLDTADRIPAIRNELGSGMCNITVLGQDRCICKGT